MFMKPFLTYLVINGLIILGITACSSPQNQLIKSDKKTFGTYKTPELPHYYLKSLDLEQTEKIHRTINIDEENRAGTLSHKGLYFLGLYLQYQTIKNHLAFTKNQTKSFICPQFHSVKVKYFSEDEKTLLNTKYSSWKYLSIKDFNELSKKSQKLYPEFSLPTATENYTFATTNLNKSIYDKNLLSKLTFHFKKIESEVEELCEYGSSKNLYIFVNMARHMQKIKSFPYNAQNLKTLLKSNIFTNYYIISSLYFRDPHFTNTKGTLLNLVHHEITNELMNRFKIPWLRQYMAKFQREKDKLDRTVQRRGLRKRNGVI